MAIARHEVVIDAPTTKVWSLLGDVTKWPAWNEHITQGRMVDGDQFFPGATFEYVYDGKPLVGTITQIDRPRSLAWRAGNTRQSIRLEPDGEKTKVTGEREVAGFVASLRKGKAEQEAAVVCQDWLNMLKAAAERSE